jgi:hypothetical protein
MKWMLLLQLVLSDRHAGEQRPAGQQRAIEQVIVAVRELGLQPAEIERVAKAVRELLPGATHREDQARHHAPVSVRVWVSGTGDNNRPRTGPDAGSCDRSDHAGWGFFVVHRQEGDPQVSPGRSHDVVELYLYQEADLQRMRHAPRLG